MTEQYLKPTISADEIQCALSYKLNEMAKSNVLSHSDLLGALETLVIRTRKEIEIHYAGMRAQYAEEQAPDGQA